MKLQPRLLVLAIGVVFAAPAFASPVVRQTLSYDQFSFNLSAVDASVDAAPEFSAPSATTSFDFQRFDPTQGVLTGVRAELATRNAFLRQMNGGTGTGQTALMADWNAYAGTERSPVFQRSTAGLTSGEVSVVRDLNAVDPSIFIGSGSVGASNEVAYRVGADMTQGATGDSVRALAGIQGDFVPLVISQTLEYTYLEHAMPSFSADREERSLTLDFGTVALGGLFALDFSLFNLGGADTVGLDLDDFLPEIGSFESGLAAFQGLDAGGSKRFTARFQADTLGAQEALFRLTLSDEDVGAAASRSNYTMDLRLVGTVIDNTPPPNGVPEPGMLALLGIGLAGLGLRRRRVGA